MAPRSMMISRVIVYLPRSYCLASRSICCLRCSSPGRWFFVRMFNLGVSAHNADARSAITMGANALAVSVRRGIGVSVCMVKIVNFPDEPSGSGEI